MVVSISSVIARIKNILSSTMDLNGIWIQGEISNLTKHRSGHYYFSLKDKSSEIRCVMFSSYVQRMSFELEEGMNVLLSGSVNVYEAKGSLQLYVRSIRPDGLGQLYLEFEQRKNKLASLGYFDESHKIQKPAWINHIAILTAREGAALQDALKTIQKRWPMMKIDLYPCYVQGNLAPKSIIKQLKIADEAGYDAILLIRGGGSFEDLFCFNDVELVQTIYACKTYIVSGVGHEVDTTLCDLVSDHRSVTPTAAAQWVSLDQYEVYKQLMNDRDVLISRMQALIEKNRHQLITYASNPYLVDPKSWLLDKQYALDNYVNQLERIKDHYIHKSSELDAYRSGLYQSLQRHIQLNKNTIEYKHQQLYQCMRLQYMEACSKLKKNIELLDAYSPLKVLSRGYSITKSEDHVLKSISRVEVDDIIKTQLEDGVIISRVLQKEG